MSRFVRGDTGFTIGFRNGYGVSVQFGPGHYAINYDMERDRIPERLTSPNAEVAVFGPNKDEKGRQEMLALESFYGQTVGGRWTPGDVVTLMWWAMQQDGEPNEAVLMGPRVREREEEIAG